MSQKQVESSVKRLLRIKEVLARLSISRSSFLEGCRTGRFPQPIKIGPRTTVWKIGRPARHQRQGGYYGHGNQFAEAQRIQHGRRRSL